MRAAHAAQRHLDELGTGQRVVIDPTRVYADPGGHTHAFERWPAGLDDAVLTVYANGRVELLPVAPDGTSPLDALHLRPLEGGEGEEGPEEALEGPLVVDQGPPATL